MAESNAPRGGSSGELNVICGPLLNYRRMSRELGQSTWHGSVLVVTAPGSASPELALQSAGALRPEEASLPFAGPSTATFAGEKLYEEPAKAFWRFTILLPFQEFECKWEYRINNLAYAEGSESKKPQVFVVPAVSQSMRLMFHSCNGFSVGTDLNTWTGPVLWKDVLRVHAQRPLHVMIGGGDQIYNDGVRVDGPLRPWTDIGNPHKRREYPFDEALRARCDEYYYDNYVRWYNTEPFSTANGQIPQLNIWDDHDIIDGFGSYTHHFMRCPVFRGIGGVAHKYYLLFQHHIPPPKSTFTTDAPQTTRPGAGGSAEADPAQLKDSYVKLDEPEDSSFILGPRPGPYVEERSRSVYCQLGARMAFLGIDARMERTRHQINYPETYDLLFQRLKQEFSANPDIKHLILLLGVPIAYPRLQWLENIFTSPIIGPIKFLNKRFGFAGSLFNKFDGQVDLLDDLDDHYTAHQHKKERKELIHRLQDVAQKHSVRVTILGGDVHLAALGRFFANPKLGIQIDQDYRYMVNIVSSAITNKPPPQAVANLLARRNKIHHIDHDTDETLLELFDYNPGFQPGGDGSAEDATTNGNAPASNKPDRKTSNKNHATMPSRNYAIIAESHPEPTRTTSAPLPANGHAHAPDSSQEAPQASPTWLPVGAKANTRKAIQAGEQGAGTEHPAASGLAPTGRGGRFGLDVTIRVEVHPGDTAGTTVGYGLSVPGLDAKGFREQGEKW